MTNPRGRFGVHGGQYIPETLMNAVIELEEAYNYYKTDPEFNRELAELFNEYAGRPSRLYYAAKMTADLGGAKIYLKREDPTTYWDRLFSQRRWEKHASSPRPVQASTVSRRPLRRH